MHTVMHCVAYLLPGVDFLATIYQLLLLFLLATLFVYVWTKRKVKSFFAQRN